MFKDFLENLPDQIPQALAIGRALRIPEHYGKVKQVLFYGMGGSAISGDILRVLVMSRSRDFFVVEHGGKWPPWAGKETLAVFSSYSGNSAEVLDHLKDALKAKSRILVVTSGGKLGKIARRKHLPCLMIPGGMPPRCAIGYLTFSVLPVLERIGRFHIPAAEISETIRQIKHASRQHARTVAKALYGKSVHLYAMLGVMEPVLQRWRAQLAENAKTLVSHYVIPEFFHNEIEGWVFPKEIIRKSRAVFILDKEDNSVFSRKRRFAQKLIRKAGGGVIEIPSRGKSELARLFSLIALGDWVSYELALLNKVNPLTISKIESVKKIK